MRLLTRSDEGEIVLTKDIPEDQVPPYAILSHTWGTSEEEVSFQDMSSQAGRGKPGFEKIRFCLQTAQRDHLQYCWVDTCCIDKTNSAELSEAINSMFRWYKNAARCYVYLVDVMHGFAHWRASFRGCRWLTRGWTLQELLAPPSVEFYSEQWQFLGDKQTLSGEITQFTGIATTAIEGAPLSEFGVEERLTWANRRQTARGEDKAYSLFGLFEVFMPLVYGEGEAHALKRLREEIEKQSSVRKDDLLDWISRTNGRRKHQDVFEQYQPGTCTWFLQHQSLKDWLDGPQKRLWCVGIPGSGKTTLSAVLIEHLLSRPANPSPDAVLFLYCDYNDQTSQSGRNLFTFLLRQLVEQTRALPDEVKSRYLAHRRLHTQLQAAECIELLRLTMPLFHDVYIVVDALDECTRNAAECLLEGFLQLEDARIVITSRENPLYLGRYFRSFPRLEVRASADDVQTYVRARLERSNIAEVFDAYPDLMAQVSNDIVQKAGGMFLLCRLQVTSFRDLDSRRDVLQALSSLPSELFATYDTTMKRIMGQPEAALKRAMDILLWVVFTLRPISVEELRHALTIQSSQSAFDETGIPLKNMVTSYTAGLVMIDERSLVVRLVHETANVYLQRELSRLYPQAHLHMARACLTYLSYDDLATTRTPFLAFPFLDYATRFWGKHIRLDSSGIDQSTKDLALSFLRDTSKVVIASRIMSSPHRSWRLNGSMTGLHLCSFFGLRDLLMELLAHEGYLDNVDDLGRTALSYGAEGGHEDVVKLLLDHGAAVNLSGHPHSIYGDHSFRNPLSYAVERGHLATIQLLLDRGASAGSPTFLEQSALGFAAERGDLAIVQLLLDRDPPSTALKASDDALSRAANKGHLAVVELLLQFGFKVDYRDGDGRTVLSLASERGDTRLVSLLTDNNATPNTKSKDRWTPLMYAAKNGHTPVLLTLLDRGADIDARDNWGRRALDHANINRCALALTILQEKHANNPQVSKTIEVVVKGFDGRLRNFEINTRTTCLELKADIENVCGYVTTHQYLFQCSIARWIPETTVLFERGVSEDDRIEVLCPIWKFRVHQR